MQTEAKHLITDHLSLWAATRGPKGDAYGIKKLRELILELAVRGMLVAQDPSDEPASVLLERIAAEKARLVKEGKIKKQKTLPEIDKESLPFPLPQNWEWSRLGVVTNYGDTEKVEPGSAGDDAWVLELEDIEKETSRLIKRVRCSERKFRSAKNRFQKNDVLYGKLRPYLDKVLVADEDGVCTTEVIPVRAYMGVTPEFVRLVMKSPQFRWYANESTHGMNLPRLGTLNARMALFPSVPEAEQHRIVAKVDELMALCDQLEQQQQASHSAHQTLVDTLLAALTREADQRGFQAAWQRIAAHFDTLFTTERSIDALKQTLLQLAVMGKLVPQDPNDEPASVLLERIAAEKARLVKEGKIKKQKALAVIGEDEKPFELPSGWEWSRINDFTLRSEAGWSPSCEPTPRVSGNWGVLKVSAVTWGEYRPDENKALPESLEPRNELEVGAGDFLISRANTAELVARAVVVPNDSPPKLMMSDKLIRFVFSDEVASLYINLVNNSPVAREYYAGVAGGTSSSMKNVSREQIRKLVVPLPSLAEQHCIVAKVDELMTLCDSLKGRLQAAQTTQQHLADAIAEQALA